MGMESANWEQIQFSPEMQMVENEYGLHSTTCSMSNPVWSHCSERGRAEEGALQDLDCVQLILRRARGKRLSSFLLNI